VGSSYKKPKVKRSQSAELFGSGRGKAVSGEQDLAEAYGLRMEEWTNERYGKKRNTGADQKKKIL